MPPKVKFTKNDVIGAALTIVEEQGSNELTARNIAAKLGSSTAPVYKHFDNMEELAHKVIRDIQKSLLEYSSRSYTDRVFLNMGTGIAMFACEHKNLYRALMLEGDNYGDVVYEFLDILEKELAKDSRLTNLPASERRVLLNKMWTFTHGLASLICVGLIKNCSQEKIINILLDMGSDVIGSTLTKFNKSNNGN